CRRALFFFQAEDGIRALYVTGVQTCALPICSAAAHRCGRLALVPHPFRVHPEGRHRLTRPAVLRDADRVLPAGDRDRARAAQGGLNPMNKRSTLGGGTLLALALLFIGLTILF